MTWEAGLTCAVVCGMLVALMSGIGSSELIIWVALALLVFAGQIADSKLLPSPDEAVAGLGNSSLVTVALLLIVVEGLMRTRATDRLTLPLLKITRTRWGVIFPILMVVGIASSFLNNTAIVAMFLPIIRTVSQRTGIAPSRLFLPMCYAATLGGVCTLIGTSTNLVVDGLMRKAGMPGLSLFELSWVGIPILTIGVAYLIWAGRFILGSKKPAISLTDDPRDYVVEMQVDPQGPLVGKTVEDAGLRHLQGLYLAEIQHGEEIIASVGPHDRLFADDVLVFVGIVDSVVELRKLKGLNPATDSHFDFKQRPDRCLMEVVVSPHCPLIDQTIREGNFRSEYEATILAVAHEGQRIKGKIGDHILSAGDTLLLETHPEFAEKHRLSRHFYVVSAVENSTFSEKELNRSNVALAILLAIVVSVAFGWINILLAALLGAVLMVLLECCSIQQARASLDLSLLLVIAGAFGIAQALETSGAATYLSQSLVNAAGGNPWWSLAAIYLATLLTTELVTNNAAAAIMFPISVLTANSIGVSATPFMVAVMVSASCGFATPFGYQTNLMVAGPGGYKFIDYVKLGLPLDFIVFFVAIQIIPRFWPF